MLRTRASTLPRHLASWLMLLALLVRGLVPAGFMPDVGALRHGVYAITICTGTSQQNVIIDQDGNTVDRDGQGSPGGDHPGEVPCLFAVAAQIAAVLFLAVALVLLALERAGWRLPAAELWRIARPPGSPGARAPPAWA